MTKNGDDKGIEKNLNLKTNLKFFFIISTKQQVVYIYKAEKKITNKHFN